MSENNVNIEHKSGPRAACLGILVVDVIARPVNNYPQRGALNLCDAMAPFIGGCAANTGIAMNTLGVQTNILGKVGRDGFGDFVCTTFQNHGIDARGIVRDDEKTTSATMVMVATDAERSFIHYPGANGNYRACDVDWAAIEGAQLLHIAGHFLMPSFDGEPCAETLREARRRGVRTALDTAGSTNTGWREVLQPCLEHLDYFVPSYSEARFCTPFYGTDKDRPENVARWFRDQGVGTVALKMGTVGSYVLADEGEWRVPPFRVRAVDATGAGDAFAAGFLAGVLHGYDVAACAELGNAVGACCVTAVGTVDGVLSLEQTLAFIEEQKQNGWLK